MKTLNEITMSHVTNALSNYNKAVKREAQTAFNLISRIDRSLAFRLQKSALNHTIEVESMENKAKKDSDPNRTQIIPAPIRGKHSENKIECVSRLLTEESLESIVRKMKNNGMTPDDVAEKLSQRGGYDADHLGHVIVKIFHGGKKRKSKA